MFTREEHLTSDDTTIRLATADDLDFLPGQDRHMRAEVLRVRIGSAKVTVAYQPSGVLGWLRVVTLGALQGRDPVHERAVHPGAIPESRPRRRVGRRMGGAGARERFRCRDDIDAI